MKQCAFLSMDNLDAFECYDHLLVEPLQQRGWSVQEVSWRNKRVDWNQFEVVVIRSSWDYQDNPKAFLETLRTIDQSSAHLENSLKLVEWNIDKTYLQDLQNRGIEIVPSLWRDHFKKSDLDSFFDALNTNEIIIKPTVSANADDTFRIHRSKLDDFRSVLSSTFQNRPYLVQPFMQNIIEEGEFSVFFFDDTYSHSILKTPKPTDFRVQEEHGGQLKLVEEANPSLLESARQLLEKINPTPLYSRIDYVRTEKNTFALMELELIEPSLYFNMDDRSAERFARVFEQRMQKSTR
jgi:hypothetical protein